MRRFPLLRLTGYGRPYVAIVLVAMALAAVYSAARAGRAVMIRPLMDGVLLERTDGSSDLDLWPPPPDLWTGVVPDAVASLFEREPEAIPADVPKAAVVGERMWGLFVLGAFLALILPVAHFGKDYLIEYAMGRVLVDMQQDLGAHLLRLPLRFHQEARRGDALTRILSDTTLSHASLRVLFADVAQGVITLVVSLGALFAISWPLTLVALCVAPALMGVVALFGRRVRRTARRRQEQYGEMAQRLVQILSGIKVIKAFRAEGHEEKAFYRENRRLFRRSLKVVQNRVLSRTSVEAVQSIMAVGLLLLGVLLVWNGLWGLTAGSLIAFVTVMISTQGAVKEVTKSWTRIQDASASAERFFSVLDREAELPDPPDAVHIDGVRREVRIDKLSFSYGREPVLIDVSIEARAGEVVALVGRTGSGKTTLADLLLRFRDPDSGSIQIDGVDLRRIARDSLLAHVAVVTQEPFLFDGTIRDNIRYGRPGASDADVMAAARAAHVDEFAENLPRGYDTPVGEAGSQLSGGQRQRVTIARALLKNPDILIFDEATSSLDAKSERLVQDAIDRLLSGRTVFVIAHRLSTIRHADQIVVLERGMVTQRGTHEELMERPGLYRELVRLQTEARESRTSS